MADKNSTPQAEAQEKETKSKASSKETKARKYLDPEVYDRLIDRLNDERDRLERDVRREYRNARRYVRANPEEGIGLALIGGLALGFLVGKLANRK